MKENYKQCPKCHDIWISREELLHDPDIQLLGYEVSFGGLVDGLFLFNHECGTTFALRVEDFEDLYDGPIFDEKLTGTDECPGYCLYKKNLKPCPAKCECAYVREIIQIINNYPKTG